MVTIPLQVQISVCWLPVYFGVQTAIIIDSNYSVQEGHGAITSACFLVELNLVIYGIYVFKKAVFLCLLDDKKCIIYKPSP